MNDRRLLAASVISVLNTNFVYPSCQNCFSRLFLDLKRYSCQKCGCSGDIEDANYRYRLSLEAADAQDVFEVTVFGSCLDAYFGVTARGLKRYIDELKQEAGAFQDDSVPGVVFQAAEACFVGKKFVFGLKGSNMPDSTTFFQNTSRINRHPRVFTACHMFMPNSQLLGCTVIHYLQQHQYSHLHRNQGSLWPPNFSMAFDLLSRDLSNLRSSHNLDIAPLSFVEGPSNLWPQSFGLTTTSVSLGTTADPVALSLSKTDCEEHRSESNPVSLCTPSVLDCNLSMNKKNEQAVSCLHSSKLEKCELDVYSCLRKQNHRWPQSQLQLENTSINRVSTQHRFGPEKSWNLLPHQRQDSSLCSSYIETRAGKSAQEVSWLWEELPSSESFNQFIANIECNQAAVSPTNRDASEQSPIKQVGEFHGLFNQLSPKPDIWRTNFINNHPDTERKRLKKGLSFQQAHLVSTPITKESHQKIIDTYVPTEGGRAWSCLKRQPPAGAPYSYSKQNCFSPKEEINHEVSSSKNLHSCSSAQEEINHEVSCSKNLHSCSSAKEEINHEVSSSKNLHFCSSPKEGINHEVSSSKNLHSCPLKYIGNSLKRPARKTAIHINSKHDGGSTSRVNKGSFNYWLNQTTEFTGVWEQRFTSATCEQSGKGSDVISLSKSYSSYPRVNYNASADLFEVSAAAEALNAAQTFSAHEGKRTKNCIPTEFTSSEQHACGERSFGHELPLYKSSSSDQKTSTPLTWFQSKSECSFISIPDFVPNPQFTPLARPYQQASFPREEESILNKLPVDKRSQSNARCKKTRLSLKNPVAKCLVSKLLPSRRTSDANSGISSAPDPQELFVSCTSAKHLPEKDNEEWIPPSEKKWIKPLAVPNGKMLRRNQIRKLCKSPVRQKLFLSENKICCGVPQGCIKLRAKLTPNRQQATEDDNRKLSVDENGLNFKDSTDESPGFSAFADVKALSSSCTKHGAATWSPELFVDDSPLPNRKDFI